MLIIPRAFKCARPPICCIGRARLRYIQFLAQAHACTGGASTSAHPSSPHSVMFSSLLLCKTHAEPFGKSRYGSNPPWEVYLPTRRHRIRRCIDSRVYNQYRPGPFGAPNMRSLTLHCSWPQGAAMGLRWRWRCSECCCSENSGRVCHRLASGYQ